MLGTHKKGGRVNAPSRKTDPSLELELDRDARAKGVEEALGNELRLRKGLPKIRIGQAEPLIKVLVYGSFALGIGDVEEVDSKVQGVPLI